MGTEASREPRGEQVTEISGFFLPTLKNPLASKNTVNTGLVAPASAYSTSYTAPGLPGTNTTLDGDSGNSTAAAEEEEDGEDSLYSDVAELEYDYDEELYDEEEDNEPRSIPTDPIGSIIYYTTRSVVCEAS